MIEKGKTSLVKVSVIATALGFLLGSAVLLITGRNPLLMFADLFKSVTGLDFSSSRIFNPRLPGEFIVQVMPICMTGLSVGFAFRIGLFNIGAEGQLMMGSLGAAVAAQFIHAPLWIHLPLVLLAAIIFGAIWGAIPGLLKAFFGIHEVVVTIMMNYVALYFCNWAILDVLGTVDKIKTKPFPASSLLMDGNLQRITDGSRLNWGFIIVLLAVAVCYVVIERTSFGYSIRAAGFNKDAARAAGMKVRRDIVLSMAISGALAALGGAIITLGTFGVGRYLPAFEGYGMDGIAVALVGANNALGILLSSLLFGMLKAGGTFMQIDNIPKDINEIIQAAIVFFVAIKYGIDFVLERMRSRRSANPAADIPAEPVQGAEGGRSVSREVGK